MSIGGLLRIGVVCMAAAAGAAPVAAAGASGSGEPRVEVSTSRSEVSTPLGGSFSFTSTIKNTGSTPVSGLVAHLNVVGLSEDIYVDPEDWSEERTKHLAPVPSGQSTDVSWSVKAVTGGKAAIYVVVLPEQPEKGPGRLAVSPALDVQISERKTLNTGGVLPLALGVPALLGLGTLALRIRQR